jgi:hypothetical protein
LLCFFYCFHQYFYNVKDQGEQQKEVIPSDISDYIDKIDQDEDEEEVGDYIHVQAHVHIHI